MPRRPLDPADHCPPIIVDDGSIDQKLVILENKLVPKNLGSIPVAAPLEDESYIYVDNAGVPSKIKASTLGEQINADWNETNPESKAYIKNKPTIPAAQIQSDWNQTDTSALDYIKNKPTLGSLAAKDKVVWSDLDEATIQRRIVTAEDEIDEVEGRVDTLTGTVQGIQLQVTHLQDDVTHLEADKQNKLTAGENITITETSEGTIISSHGGYGTMDYEELEHKPTINGTVLVGEVHLRVDGGEIVAEV